MDKNSNNMKSGNENDDWDIIKNENNDKFDNKEKWDHIEKWSRNSDWDSINGYDVECDKERW